MSLWKYRDSINCNSSWEDKNPDKIIDDAIKKCKKADKKIYLTSLNGPKPNPINSNIYPEKSKRHSYS